MCKVKLLVAFLFAFCFSVALPSAALAAGSFPAVNTYQSGYYHDVPAGEWYADAAKLCYETGLITGTSSTTLAPKGNATRAQAAMILMRFCEVVVG